MENRRSVSLEDASCINVGDSSTMKCVLLGLLGVSLRFISCTMRRASASISPARRAAVCSLKSPGVSLSRFCFSQVSIPYPVKTVPAKPCVARLFLPLLRNMRVKKQRRSLFPGWDKVTPPVRCYMKLCDCRRAAPPVRRVCIGLFHARKMFRHIKAQSVKSSKLVVKSI